MGLWDKLFNKTPVLKGYVLEEHYPTYENAKGETVEMSPEQYQRVQGENVPNDVATTYGIATLPFATMSAPIGIGSKLGNAVLNSAFGGGVYGGINGAINSINDGENPLLGTAKGFGEGALVGGALGVPAHYTGELLNYGAKKALPYIRNVRNGGGLFDRLQPSIKILDQDSWHGTPYEGDITKFDLDFMGTGEGAQMYGAGIYTAKDKSIANRHYRFMGNNQEPISYKGKPLLNLYDDLERQANKLHPREAQPLYDKMSLIEDLDYKGEMDNLDYFNSQTQQWYKLEVEPNLTMPGRLYRVQVPDNDVLLHSDLPLNKQPEKVQKALRDMFFDSGIDIDDVSNTYNMGALNNKPYSEVDGQTLYNIMNGLIDGNATNRKATSKLFDKYGIKGIRAFGDKDGEIFVTFNPDNAKIIESYYPNKLYEKLTNSRQ